MKIGENEGQFFFKKLFHIPPVPSFHGNRFRNTVTFRGCLWFRVCVSDKVAAAQKKSRRGDTEIKKGAGKTRVYGEGGR